jgi:hypothetical protein
VIGDGVEDAAHMEHSQMELTLVQNLRSDAQNISKHWVRTETFVKQLTRSVVVTHDDEARCGGA